MGWRELGIKGRRPLFHPVVGYDGTSRHIRCGTVDLELALTKVGKPARKIRRSAMVGFDEGREAALWGYCGFLEYFDVTFRGSRKPFIIRDRAVVTLPGPVFGPGD